MCVCVLGRMRFVDFPLMIWLLSNTRWRRRRRRRVAAFTATAAAAAFMLSSASTVSATTTPPTLPYVPTTILLSGSALLPPSNITNTAYIFSPSSSSTDSTGVDLLAIDISSTIHVRSLQPKILSTNLPFIDASSSSPTAAFAPSLLDNGSIAVLAGDCAVAAAGGASIWTYTSSGTADKDSAREWTHHTTTPSSSWDYAQGGPYLLGGSLGFSEQLAPVMSEPVLYFYGGMCPSANRSSTDGDFSASAIDSWQAEAVYSNRMLRVSPPPPSSSSSSSSSSGSDSDGTYTLAYTPNAYLQQAEAGFTLTALAPSLSNRSGIVTQQASHVVLGGHVQQNGVFVNISTAAVWSLPEEVWTRVDIQAPSPATDGSIPSVDPRSGHTTVLSEDGSSLVVLGGWAGNVSNAAQPQLVVVTIGASFAEWQWSVPAGEAQPAGPGRYGHGAALLPGNVMMVYGGYEIVPPPATDKTRKTRRQATGEQQMFFNLTSMSWSDSYTNPQHASGGSGGSSGGGGGGGGGGGTTNGGSPPPSSGGGGSGSGSGSPTDDETSPTSLTKKLGLGLGLGIGIPILLAALLLAFFLHRRRQRRRAQRDAALHGLALGMNGGGSLPLTGGSGSRSDEMLERSDDGDDTMRFPWNAASARSWYTGGHDPYTQGRKSLGYETMRGAASRDNNNSYNSGGGGGGGYSYSNAPAVYMPTGPAGSSTLSSSSRPRGAARGLYQPTSLSTSGGGGGGNYDFSPLRVPNRIHPIYEDDEGDDEEDGGDLGASGPLSPDRDDDDDPFMTPTGSSSTMHMHTPRRGSGIYLPPPPMSSGAIPVSGGSIPTGSNSPEIQPLQPQKQQQQGQDPEVQGWVSDVDAADAVLTARISRHGSTTTTTTTPPAILSPTTSGTIVTITGGGPGNHSPTTPTRPTHSPGRLSPSRRASSSRSVKGGGAGSTGDSDETVRTGSNLSDRSAFSFVQGAEQRALSVRSHFRAAFSGGTGSVPGVTPAATEARLGSSSGSSAHTFSTAKSTFATMQAEGPALLLGSSAGGGYYEDAAGGLYHAHYATAKEEAREVSAEGAGGEEEDDDYVNVPGSPSKSKLRHSWFGSLRRVFSGATPSPGSSSREDSPTRESLLEGSSGDYEPPRRLAGIVPGAGGTLLRRKQGREAWEKVKPQHGGESSSSPRGDGNNHKGGDEEWDVEKAVEQRLVQVMFTVPKERLRVVNAEIEHEEEIVVVVDPEKGDDEEEYEHDGDDEEGGYDQLLDSSSSSSSSSTSGDAGKMVSHLEHLRPADSYGHDHDHDHDRSDTERERERQQQHRGSGLLDPGSVGGVSPSTSLRSASVTTTIHTAEAVRLERPRTRVLEMVESIESKSSRDNSPSASPTR
ncbi:hypothetical protein B0T17DRAFT_589344 [Bombardia bombarda]|uniref:Galactose oxidase n=1 Tax=Bombardia bombarda TaxID=252184 RepID=A0AA39X956_9PEZI|nr:hypothetical protein B0T17DRAFT_589344 [Bombardia bombarda]